MTERGQILITTSTFAEYDHKPLTLLEQAGFRYARNPYGRTLTRDELIDLIDGSVGIIAGTERLDANTLKKMGQVRAISRCGVGIDNVDIKTAEELSIRVTNTPDSATMAVAELTVGLILSLIRKISAMDRDLKTGKWNKQTGNLLFGKKVGILGFGKIGQRVAELLSAFKVEIGFCDVVEKQNDIARQMPLEDLCRWADIICIHVSGECSQRYVVGKAEIDLMKRGVWIVNCSRGGVVDETALLEGLLNGKIAGAALDVFSEEPYQGPLAHFDNVVLTPHVGSYAREARIKMEIQAVENLLESLRSRK